MTRLAMLFAVLLSACGGKSAPETKPLKGSATPSPGTDAPPGEAAPPPDPAQAKADLLAAEQAAYQKARPVFDRYCAKCHSKESRKARPKTLGHFDMTAYPFGGHHAMEVSAEVRKALGIGGGKATMPFDDPGAVEGEELALIAAWADAFDAAHAGGAHEGAGHEHGGHKH